MAYIGCVPKLIIITENQGMEIYSVRNVNCIFNNCSVGSKFTAVDDFEFRCGSSMVLFSLS